MRAAQGPAEGGPSESIRVGTALSEAANAVARPSFQGASIAAAKQEYAIQASQSGLSHALNQIVGPE